MHVFKFSSGEMSKDQDLIACIIKVTRLLLFFLIFFLDGVETCSAEKKYCSYFLEASLLEREIILILLFEDFYGLHFIEDVPLVFLHLLSVVYRNWKYFFLFWFRIRFCGVDWVVLGILGDVIIHWISWQLNHEFFSKNCFKNWKKYS